MKTTMPKTASKEDRMRWAFLILTTHSAQELLAVMDNIWEDGYRTAELEVTYSMTPEEVVR